MAQLWLSYPPFAREIATTLDDESAPTRLIQEWDEKGELYQAHTRTMFENFLRMAGLL
jgi:hypothetical protein